MALKSPLIVNLSDIKYFDKESVGKKIYELGKMYERDIPMPSGFIITAEFFKEYLRLTGIDNEIKKANALIHPAISDSIHKLFEPIQKRILETPIPEELTVNLHLFYRHYFGSKNKSMNIFSSSLNNKFITFSKISGDSNLVLKIKQIWSQSLKNPEAIAVQEYIRPEIQGKIFTNNIIVNIKLTGLQMNKLKDYCKRIQECFYFPKEIEYIVNNGKVFITNVSPLTGQVYHSIKPRLESKIRKIMAKGTSISPGIVTGPIRIVSGKLKNNKIKEGEIIIITNHNHSLLRALKNAKAIIIDSDNQNMTEKNFYRKSFNIPTIINVKDASNIFKTGNIVTVNGLNGEIYSGGLL